MSEELAWKLYPDWPGEVRGVGALNTDDASAEDLAEERMRRRIEKDALENPRRQQRVI